MTTAVQQLAVPEIAKQSDAAPQEYLWTADDFERACEAGALGHDRRLELIHGRIIDRMGQSPLHLSLRVRIGRRLRAALEPRCLIIEECSIRIDFDGEPVADVAVLRGKEGDYEEQHPSPSDVLIIVEVAVSSVENDLGGKAVLYAQAGIIEYWVVLPNEKEIVVHRDPTSDGYASVIALGAGQSISPLAAPETVLAVADLLGLPEVSAAAQTGTNA